MEDPVVLIHGMWCAGSVWNRVRGLLEPRGYRCFAPTLPDHDAGPDQPLRVARRSLRDYAAFLEVAIAEQAFDKPPILIGHSMGGLLAQQLATRVQPLALVLLTPAAPWGILGLRASNVVAFAPWLVGGRFWRRAYRPSFARARVSVFHGLPADRHRDLYAGLVHESGRATAEIGFWWADPSRATAVRAQDVRCPAYVVGCGEDRLTPASVVRRVAARYPQAEMHLDPRRGHWVIDDDRTEEMVQSICAWLEPIRERRQDGV